jgi:copper chaperone
MTTFNVPDMTCGHCEAVITKAIQELDSTADVKADLAANKITVTSKVDGSEILAALEATGYPSSLSK